MKIFTLIQSEWFQDNFHTSSISKKKEKLCVKHSFQPIIVERIVHFLLNFFLYCPLNVSHSLKCQDCSWMILFGDLKFMFREEVCQYSFDIDRFFFKWIIESKTCQYSCLSNDLLLFCLFSNEFVLSKI